MTKKSFQYWALQILIILTIIYVSSKISFLFEPVGIFVSTLFFPIIISGFLYFLLNPLVNLLVKWKIPRVLSIILLYIAIIGLVVLAIGNLVPVITRQVMELVNDIPGYARDAQRFFNNFANTEQYRWLMTQQYVTQEEIIQRVTEYANTLPDRITNGITNIFGLLANIAITIVTVPLLLFFMFKDGHKLKDAIAKFIPVSYRSQGVETLEGTAKTLSAYIQGQITVALFVGTLSFIGFLIVGLEYALVMALIVAVTNIIPYVGPIIGGAPAVIVALFDSPTKAFLVLVVIVIAQQLEGNLLSPLILGKSLDTHPATIVILLLVAGNLAGLLGMVLAVPTYAVAKTIVLNVVRFLRLRREASIKTET
ncbi:Predicted PurR-regulated permease PerM [Mesobacillus persicus]|uniref:Predicted PurR-regulated permease PerM n=1 Tax=Mesobacillus persicus TaxID=930146 RepID=A0A1H8FRC8_9BACI|nr:AI-2E family transporter [Mesobacillus persicus]SEN34252.1 Predicted PurR-regulated permease PerM [Mesobacillus persicus]